MTTETIDPAIAVLLHEGVEDYDEATEAAPEGGAIAVIVVVALVGAIFALGVAIGHWGMR